MLVRSRASALRIASLVAGKRAPGDVGAAAWVVLVAGVVAAGAVAAGVVAAGVVVAVAPGVVAAGAVAAGVVAGGAAVLVTATVVLDPEPASDTSEAARTPRASTATTDRAMIGRFQFDDVARRVRAAAPQ